MLKCSYASNAPIELYYPARTLSVNKLIDQFTLGYHIQIVKKDSYADRLIAQSDNRSTDFEYLLKISEALLEELRNSEAERYIISAHCLNPTHEKIILLKEKLTTLKKYE